MPLDLDFQLRLEERTADRVFVSVLLSPHGEDTTLDGVALELQSKNGERLGNRLLLPIAGSLGQAMVSTVEVRAFGDIPSASVVRGTAWRGCTTQITTLPTDPISELQSHARGLTTHLTPDGKRYLDPLEPEERAKLVALYPWLAEPMIPPTPEGENNLLEEEMEEEEAIDNFCSDLGLEGEDAEWLRDLLSEEEPKPS